jgi:hypothetical protein
MGACRSAIFVELSKLLYLKREKERKTREGVRNIQCNFAVNARDQEREVTDEK